MGIVVLSQANGMRGCEVKGGYERWRELSYIAGTQMKLKGQAGRQ